MNNTRLNTLLDSIYELEGLVHLAIARDDIPASLPELIARKGEEMAKKAKAILSEDDSEILSDDTPTPPSKQAPVNNPIIENQPEPVRPREIHQHASANAAEPRGRLVFSLNDRYRFKRELFSNSNADFNNTLALVASMDSYDEAEDYFLGELQWNPSKPEVADFLEILKKYFN